MGFASGFQVGAQAVERGLKLREEEQERRAMEKIRGATANEFQDYGTAGTQQIQGLQSSGAYDVQAIPGAEGQAPTLRYTPKQGLDLQGDMPAPAGAYIDVAPQRMTEYLGQRYEGGLAPERMETIRTRAMANAVADPRLRQQMLMSVTAEERAQAAEGRAQAGELRTQAGFETQQTAANLTIEEQRRLKKQRDEDEARQKQLSKDWADRLSVKDADGNVTGMRPPTNEDMMWAAQSNAKNLAAAGKTTEALASFKDYMTTAKGQIELQGAERTEAIRAAVAKVNNGNLDAAKDFYDKFVPDGAKVKEFKQNADGSITVKRVDLNGSPLPDTKTTKDDILKGLVAFNDPAKLIDYAQQSFMNNIQTEQLGLQRRNTATSEAQLRVSQANQLLAEDTAASNKMTQMRQLSIAEQRAKQALPQGLKTFKDKEGNAVLVDTTRLEVGKDGVLKTPKGLVPVTTQTEPSYGDVRNLAADILKDPQQNKKMVDGKKVPITPAEAAAKARAALIKQNANMGDEDPTDRLIRLMRNAQAGNVVDSEVD
jgi:hypothetical protein